MPPRLQCFNLPRALRHWDILSKATFSTAPRALAYTPSSSATNSLLSSIDTPANPTSTSPSSTPTPTRRNAPGNESSHAHMKHLLEHAVTAHTSPSPTVSGSGSRSTNFASSPSFPGSASIFSGPSAAAPTRTSSTVLQDLRNDRLGSDLTRQLTRRWRAGDVYAPHDLSSAEMRKWKRRGRPESDAFDTLALDPVGEYKNFAMMSEYMTPMGRIMSAKETGLRAVNQRRIAKAIRRSKGLGLMPSVHRHPEILYKQEARLRFQNGRMRVS